MLEYVTASRFLQGYDRAAVSPARGMEVDAGCLKKTLQALGPESIGRAVIRRSPHKSAPKRLRKRRWTHVDTSCIDVSRRPVVFKAF